MLLLTMVRLLPALALMGCASTVPPSDIQPKRAERYCPQIPGALLRGPTETRAADVGRAEGATHSRDGVRNVGAEAGAAIDAYRPMEPEARGAP
ncbi:Uncharacterised protein [Leminorella grimontii]|nr:Uncharacterised protein [Leminorella grimontii]